MKRKSLILSLLAILSTVALATSKASAGAEPVIEMTGDEETFAIEIQDEDFEEAMAEFAGIVEMMKSEPGSLQVKGGKTCGTFAGSISFYADSLEGNKTSNGERYSPTKMTAAHPSLPFGSCLHVTNKKNGKSVTVRVNDRGPYAKGRVLDVSRRAAEGLGMISAGHQEAIIRVCASGC